MVSQKFAKCPGRDCMVQLQQWSLMACYQESVGKNNRSVMATDTDWQPATMPTELEEWDWAQWQLRQQRIRYTSTQAVVVNKQCASVAQY